MSDDDIIAVVQAHKEGKKIQGRVLPTSKWYQRGIDDAWENMAICSWNFSDCEYRVVPEPHKPREWWLVRMLENRDGFIGFPCKQSCCDREQIHVREVLGNE